MSSGDTRWENVRVTFEMPDEVKKLAKDYQETMDEISKALSRTQMSDALKEQLIGWADPPKASEVSGVTLSSWGDNTNPQPGWHSWTSDKVEPKGLSPDDIRLAMEKIRGTGLSAREAADKLSRLARVVHLNGHKDSCLYQDGSSDYACTCQPPTVWGRVLMWYCDCCGLPRSPMKYGLCDLCHGHQYDPVEKARADHEALGLA